MEVISLQHEQKQELVLACDLFTHRLAESLDVASSFYLYFRCQEAIGYKPPCVHF